VKFHETGMIRRHARPVGTAKRTLIGTYGPL
jgi:hypothetical protein